MKYIYLILTMLFAVGCATTKQFDITPSQEFETAYINKTSSQIMEEFGMPKQVIPNDYDGAILVYEETIAEFISMDSSEDGSSTSSSTITSYSSDDDESSSDSDEYSDSSTSTTVYRRFYINKDNLCYKVDTNDYLKNGVYRKYFNKITIAEMSGITALIILLNILI